MSEAHAEPIQVRIQNTIAILTAEAATVDAHARLDLRLAVETLEAAMRAIGELEAELDLVTAPELDAAEEVQRLRDELAAAEQRQAASERKLQELRERLELEGKIHQGEHERLAQLETRTQQLEDILETDAQAFGKFMDHALDMEQRKGRPKPH